MIKEYGYKKTAANIFMESAARFPDNLALWIKGNEYTYEDLRQRSVKLATAFLKNEDDLFGEHLALLVDKSLSSYCGVIAALILGMVYMPLSPRFPLTRNIFMCRKVKAKGLIVGPECHSIARDLLTHFRSRIIVVFPENNDLPNWVSDFPQHRFLCSKDFEEGKRLSPNSRLTSESGAYNLFTSGSTGMPKSVEVTHGNLLSYLDNIVDLITITPGDRSTQLFDLTFDLSVHDMFVTWQAGAALFSLPAQSPSLAKRLVNELDLTVWFSVPSTAALLKSQNQLKPNSMPTLKYSLFCGESLSLPFLREWSEMASNSTLFNLYGPTETTIAITGFKYIKNANKAGLEGIAPIGWPLKDQSVCIINQDFSPVKETEVGELCLAGSQVTNGYYADPKLTSEKFMPLPHKSPNMIWYRTGDLAHWDKEKGLIFHGRIDRQVKIRGFRVELPEIEICIKQVAKTELVAVFGVPTNTDKGFMGTVAFVGYTPKSENEISEYCQRHLPKYMIPEKIIFLDPFPTNTAGKINYKELAYLADDWKGMGID